MKFQMSKSLLIGVSAIVALGVAAGGYFIGSGVNESFGRRTVTVRGLAEQNVTADLAIWNINMTKVGGDLTQLQNTIDADIEQAKKFLVDSGFTDSEIQNKRIQVRDKYAGYSDVEILARQNADKASGAQNTGRYVIDTGVVVRSENVKLVDAVSRKLGDLVKQGITITEDYNGPMYVFNGLNDIKIKMTEESTKNATLVGEQFAADAGAKLGKIQSATQGVFSIESRDPTSSWGNDEKQSIDKKVRVVSTITFRLK